MSGVLLARLAAALLAGAVVVLDIRTGHLLATSTVDPALWTALTWLLVRWVRTRKDGLLIAAGVVTAVAMLVTGWVSSRLGAKNTLVAGLADRHREAHPRPGRLVGQPQLLPARAGAAQALGGGGHVACQRERPRTGRAEARVRAQV